MNGQVVDTLNTIVTFQLGIFAVFLFTRNTVPNRLLAIFSLSEALVLLNAVTSHNPALIGDVPWYVHRLVRPLALVWGPAYYLYVQSLVSPDAVSGKKTALHSIPFLVYLAFVVLTVILDSRAGPSSGIQRWVLFTPPVGLIIMILVNTQITAYCVMAVITYLGYRNEMKDSYSSLKISTLTWLRFIVFGYCFAHFISLSSQIISTATGTYYNFIELIVYLTFFVFFNAIFYHAWTRPAIFAGEDDLKKYKSSSLTNEESRRFSSQLTEFMTSEKPYLNPELSLSEVAGRLHIPPRHVSQVINEQFRQNFFDFINAYRVEEAKRMLSDRAASRKTVLEILYESGFNTKSSFYLAFKKSTGVAPKEYRAAAVAEVGTDS